MAGSLQGHDAVPSRFLAPEEDSALRGLGLRNFGAAGFAQGGTLWRGPASVSDLQSAGGPD